MLTYGSQVNPALGRIDYSPIVQGGMARAQGIQQAGQAYGQMFANFGKQISEGVREYVAKQEQKQKEKDAVTFMTTFLNENPQISTTLRIPTNLKGEVEDKALVKAMINSLGGVDRAISIGTSLQQFQQSQQAFAMQQEAAARQAEMDAFQIAKAQDEATERAARKTDIAAMTAAYGAVPQAVQSRVMVPEAAYGIPSPMQTVPRAGVMPSASNLPYSEAARAGLSEFLYSSGANVRTPPIPAKSLPKDLQDFALRDPNTGSVVGIDRNTVGRFVQDEFEKRAPLEAELAQITAQAQAARGVSGTASRRFEAKANELKGKIDASLKEQSKLLTKVSEFENQKPSLKVAVESLPPSKLVDRSVKEVEKTVERDASGEEKTAAFLGAYVAKGGRITPDFVEKVKDAFKSDVSVLDVGDGITVVRAGNSAQIIDRNKPMNASQMDRLKAEQYQSMLNQLAAESEWASLPLELKQAISSAAALHEKNQNMMGARMSGQEAFDARRQELMAAGAARSGAPATPAARPAAKPMGMPSGWSVR